MATNSYFLRNLLTYSMVHSPSWAANWFATSQEIPRISRNPKVHYRTHKRPPPVSILGQPNPVHTPTSHLLEIHPTITHPFTPRSPQWSPSLRFPHQDSIQHPLLTHTRHMPSPSHSFRGTAEKNVFTSPPPTFLSVEILKNLVDSAPSENTQTRHERILYACQTVRKRLATFERVGQSVIRRSTCTLKWVHLLWIVTRYTVRKLIKLGTCTGNLLRQL